MVKAYLHTHRDTCMHGYLVNFVKICKALIHYRPQTKFAKVMFLQVSVCPHWGGACVVLFGGMRGFYLGGMCGFIWEGGVHGFIQGHAWFFRGGVRSFLGGGMCGFFSFFRYNEIRSMNRR